MIMIIIQVTIVMRMIMTWAAKVGLPLASCDAGPSKGLI